MQTEMKGRALLAALALATAAGLSSCSKSASEHLALAKARIEAKEPAAATIHLKNALEQNPKLGEARFLLGRQMLASGDAPGAAAELARANELKYPVSQLVPVWAEAMLAAGQATQVKLQFASTQLPEPAAAQRLTLTLAEAHLLTSDLAGAKTMIGRALAQEADSVPAALLQARITAADGNLPAALTQADALLAKAPDNDLAWSFKGQLLSADKTKQDQALAAYTKALEINPRQVQALVALVGMQISNNQLPEAAKSLLRLQAEAPGNLFTRYYAARIKHLKGDYAAARTDFQHLLNLAPDNPTVLLASGLNELRLNALVQAETQLARVVSAQPGNAAARFYLAQTYLQLGRPENVANVLAPLLNTAQPSAEPLLLGAQARLMQGDAKGADELFQQAAKLHGKSPSVRVALALATAAKGDTDAAVNELQLVASASDGVEADLRLISARIARKEYEAALGSIKTLEKKRPEMAAAAELRGQVLLKISDPASAREAFELALKKEPRYLPAIANLAELDLQAKQPEKAIKRLEELEKLDPGNANIALARATLATRTGADPAEVLKWLQRAVQMDPRDARARMLLVERHFNAGRVQAALEAAQSALVVLPDHVMLVYALARSQQQLGDQRQALASFSRMVRLAPKEPAGYLGLASVHMATGRLDDASKTLDQLLAFAPRVADARRMAVEVAIQRKQFDQALVLTRQLRRDWPDHSAGYAMEGEVLIAQERWASAATILRAGLEKQQPEALVPRLHLALLKENKTPQANALATDWLGKHPKDLSFLRYLGETAHAAGNMDEAQTRFEQALAVAPGDPGALNNLAWLKLQAGQPGAVALAERAVAAAPEDPRLLDTLGQAYVADKNYKRALETLRHAMNRAADPAPLRLSLAKVHLLAGEPDKAVAELETLRDLGKAFPAQAEVRKLLAEHRSR